MTDRELMQMALSALEEYCEHGVLLCPIERREALRARLAQPELPLVRVEEFVELIKGNEGVFGRPVMRTEWPTEEKPWVKTYSGGKPNYTQPDETIAHWSGSLTSTPEFIAEQKAMNEALRKMVEREPILPGGGIGRHPDTPIKVQDEREENYKSFAQSAQVLGAQYDPRREPSGSWVSWENTMCNPLASARMQTQSAWKDGYDSAKKEWVGLTNAEVNMFSAGCNNGNSVQDSIRKAEAKLKEKNT